MKSYLVELIKYRELLFSFAIREIKIRYKQTLFGIGWAVIQPFAMMVIFTVIFSRFLHFESEGYPYPIFSYSALLFWTFFASSISFGPDAMIRMAELIRKIYFPREIIPVAAVFAAFIDMLIASLIFFVMMLAYEVPFSWYLLYIPLLVLIQIFFTIGVVFILGALNVFYRDIRHGIPFLIQLWMYATPIVFSMDKVPEKFRHIYVGINPMAGLIDSYRKVILHQLPPDMTYLATIVPVSVVILVIALRFFKRVEGNFSDVI